VDWKRIEKPSSSAARKKNQHTVPISFIDARYYELYNFAFRIENALRLFVYLVLKNHCGAHWASTKVSVDEDSDTIDKIYKSRWQVSRNYQYLTPPVNSPLMFLSTGELIGLILSKQNWKFFASHFSCNSNTVRQKFNEVINIRNDLAHFRPIKIGNVGRLQRIAEEMLTGIERYLLNALFQSREVSPRNEADWYRPLKSLLQRKPGRVSFGATLTSGTRRTVRAEPLR
jgi:hypothetical protein